MPGIEGLGRFTGEIYPEVDSPEVRAALAAMPNVTPWELLADGRDKVYRAEIPGMNGPIPVAVKVFATGSALKGRFDRRLGSPAARAHRTACFLREQGVPAPKSYAVLERWEGDSLEEQLLVSELVNDCESFKDALQFHYREDRHCGRMMQLLQTVARLVRQLHDAGVEHRDLGNQNILLRRQPDGSWGDAQIIDLNRARTHESMTDDIRGRDCARIALPSDLLRCFLQMTADPQVLSDAFWQAHNRTRARYHRWVKSRIVRHPLRTWRRRNQPQTYPDPPDIWIWDDRSMQAIPPIRSKDKRAYYHKRDGVSIAGSIVRFGPAVRRAYHELVDAAWTQSVCLKDRVGLGLHVHPDRWEREWPFLQQLGPLPVLVRLYHHASAEEHAFALDAVRALHTEGYPVSVAFVQDRRAVVQPRKWQAFVERAAGALSGIIEYAELGHAVNRVKWGIWTLSDYKNWMAPFANWSDRYPQVPLIGPAGIDFEYPRVLPLLDKLPRGLQFAAFSHHLYVDRRGAPENFQGKFDTLRKAALARAIARVHPRVDDRLVISEVNWPVVGTGVYSPVGSPYESPGPRHNDPSVDEETYADYMLRYFFQTLCSGMAERVYWWNLAARGFGLVDDRDGKNWRARPAYYALQDWLKTIAPATFVERTTGTNEQGFLFEHAGKSFERVVPHNPTV